MPLSDTLFSFFDVKFYSKRTPFFISFEIHRPPFLLNCRINIATNVHKLFFLSLSLFVSTIPFAFFTLRVCSISLTHTHIRTTPTRTETRWACWKSHPLSYEYKHTPSQCKIKPLSNARFHTLTINRLAPTLSLSLKPTDTFLDSLFLSLCCLNTLFISLSHTHFLTLSPTVSFSQSNSLYPSQDENYKLSLSLIFSSISFFLSHSQFLTSFALSNGTKASFFGSAFSLPYRTQGWRNSR